MKDIIGNLRNEVKVRRVEIKKIESAIVELERKFKKNMRTEKRIVKKKKVAKEFIKKNKFSSKQRKAVSNGMKKYWAEKRLAERGIPKQVQFVYGDEPKQEQKKRGRPKKRENKKWTITESKMLIGMRERGYSWKQIATRLRRTYGAVWVKHRVLMKRDKL